MNCNDDLNIKVPIYINGVFVDDTHTLLSIAGKIMNSKSCGKQDLITITMPISEFTAELDCNYMQGSVQIQRTNQSSKSENLAEISIYTFKINQIINTLSSMQDITYCCDINKIPEEEFVKFQCRLYKEKYVEYFNEIDFDINSGFQVLPNYIISDKNIDQTKLITTIQNEINSKIANTCVMYYGNNCDDMGYKMYIDEKLILDSCACIEGLPVTVISKVIKKFCGNESMLKKDYEKLNKYLKKKCFAEATIQYIEVMPLAILI